LTRDIDHIEDKVKSTFDFKNQIDQNPLMAAGLSIVGGFLLGSMIGGGKKSHEPRSFSSGYPSASYYSSSYTPSSSVYSQPGAVDTASHGMQQRDSGPGLISGVTSGVKESFRRGTGGNTVEDTISNVTAALTAILVEKAKEMLDRNLPGFADKYEQARTHETIGDPAMYPQGSGMESGSTMSRSAIDQASMSGSGAASSTTSGNSEPHGTSYAPGSRPVAQ